jgi:glycine/D-amino acid oxidase-like deaminating enzyme
MDTLRAFTHPRHSTRVFASRAPTLHTDSLARTILIVGAGFSGTAVAIHLLRLPHSGPLRIVLRPRHWETTAVPEFGVHAERLAYRLSPPVQSSSTRHYGGGARCAAGAIA